MENLKRRAWRVVQRHLALQPAERNPIVHAALIGATWVYAQVSSQKRQWLLSRQRALPVRSISFGNVTWGGTGKTPCLHHVARMVHARGFDLLLVSRGYGDDEWKMFAAEFPHSLLAIGKHRYDNALAQLSCFRRSRATEVARSSQVVALIDDGLQQWRLKKDLEIIMVDCYNPFGNGFLIPAGRLRELPEVALPSGDIVVLHHAAHLENAVLAQLQATIRRWTRPDTLIAHSRMRLTSLPLGIHLDQHVRNRHQPLNASLLFHDNLVVIGLSGIGCPQSFRDILHTTFPNAAEVKVHAFPDHYAYSACDIRSIVDTVDGEKASGRSVVIITTEKDYHRSKELLDAHLPDLRVALCELEFTYGGDEFKRRVERLLNE